MSSSDKSNPYQPDNIDLFNTLYGKNLISLGGTSAIENMISDLSCEDFIALDIGSGLGGVAFYLAETYEMSIDGMEIHPWMAEYANQNTPPHLAHLLKFHTYSQENIFPLPSNHFDLIYSKGVFNHIKDKQPILTECIRLLKPSATLLITDWLYPNHSTNSSSPLAQESESSYQALLSKAGFTGIHFRNDTSFFIVYVKSFLQNLLDNEGYLTENFGVELFLTIQKEHTSLLELMQNKQKIATRILAHKPA